MVGRQPAALAAAGSARCGSRRPPGTSPERLAAARTASSVRAGGPAPGKPPPPARCRTSAPAASTRRDASGSSSSPVAVRGANSLVQAGAARSSSRTPESSPAANQGEPPGRLAVVPGPHPRHQGTARCRRQQCTQSDAVGCRRMTGTRERRPRVLCRPPRWPRSSPARALVRSWAPGRQVHGESPRLVGGVDYTIEHVFGRRERCRR